MKNLFIIPVLLFATAAFAADQKPIADNDLGITDKDCQALVAYQPSADVEYKPGVDVHGKPVVEADITPAVVTPPEEYSFDLDVDAARFLGMTVPPGSQGLTKIGTITVEKNGQTTFNGKPLEGDAAAALKAVCNARKLQNPLKNPPK